MALIKTDAFNLTDLLERLEGDEELAEQMVALYLEDFPRQLIELEKYVGQRNYKQVQLISHGIKGASANIGAVQIQEIAYQLETGAREELDFQQLMPLFSRLNDAYTRFKQPF